MTYTVACIFSTVVLGFLFKQFAGKDVRISKIILINYLICAFIGILQMGFDVFDLTQFGSGLTAVVIGILFVAGFNAFGNAVALNGISLATVIQKLSVGLTVVVALLIGEKLNVYQWVGFILSLIAIVVIFYRKNKENSIHKNDFGRFYLLATLILSAIIEIGFLFIHKNENHNPSFEWIFTTRIFISAFIASMIYNLVSIPNKKINSEEITGGILLGIPNFFSILFLNKALGSGMQGSVFYPILNCSVILLSSVIGAWMFREHFTKQKIIGLLLALASILLVGLFR
ncbi:MAG: EamA family transporter [Saprospiraceae bacterium]|nr:EamA family transporter [Saprospiraceae bacterium]